MCYSQKQKINNLLYIFMLNKTIKKTTNERFIYVIAFVQAINLGYSAAFLLSQQQFTTEKNYNKTHTQIVWCGYFVKYDEEE